jgi:hypothetical protein
LSFHCLLLVLTLCSALHDKSVLVLSGIQAAAVSYDQVMTREGIDHGGVEINPLSRPFVHSNAAMTAGSVAEVFGTMYIAEKMRHSKHAVLRDTWFLLPLVPTAAHAWGVSTWYKRNSLTK